MVLNQNKTQLWQAYSIHFFCVLQKQFVHYSHSQIDSLSRCRESYRRARLPRAYEASGMSVYIAAPVFSVPESTVRDRTRSNVALDVIPGPETILSWKEKKSLVDHTWKILFMDIPRVTSIKWLQIIVTL